MQKESFIRSLIRLLKTCTRVCKIIWCDAEARTPARSIVVLLLKTCGKNYSGSFNLSAGKEVHHRHGAGDGEREMFTPPIARAMGTLHYSMH